MPSPSASPHLDALRLLRSENVGPVTFRRLIDRFGTPSDALAALPDLAKRGGRSSPLRVCTKAEAERELAAAHRLDARLMAWTDPDYPEALAAVDDAPPLFYVRGHAHLLARRSVGIVGARNASVNGRKLATLIARGIGEAGLVVVSGLARGIDTAAHQAALPTGTVAVQAGGIDRIYPPENEGLYHRIAEEGALVAEMPPGTEPQARHFPRRNRIVSGLSLGVVVVEAAARSGSLITARFALEQGREVFAVPGSPLDPRCQGSNRLLREGAVMTEGADDVLETLRPLLGGPLGERRRPAFAPAAPAGPADEAELAAGRRAVLEALSFDPVLVDELVRECQLSVPVVATILLELELAGRLQRFPGHRVALI
ncbi:MAG TPA: DNA-processing protein DprA [Azospirillaceae bacterium]|nr:DNA-processing protein DprA [Azospirillaceae bacterium]